MGRRMLALGVVFAAACGGGGGQGSPTPASPLPSVGGDYTTAVALAENTCAPPDVQALPTRVEHAPGATTFRLTHGATYTCSLAAGGGFTCAPQAFDVAGRTETVTLDGRFRTTGFDATARVAVAPAGCAYAVRWTGTKQGAPNILP